MTKIGNLVGGGVFVPNISENGLIPVGGNILGAGSAHRICTDFSSPICASILAEVKSKFENNDINALIDDIADWGVSCNPETFTHLYVVQKILEQKMWQHTQSNSQLRLEFYRTNPDVKLSKAIETNPAKFKGGGQAPAAYVTSLEHVDAWLRKARHQNAFMKLNGELTGAASCYGACPPTLTFRQSKYVIQPTEGFTAQPEQSKR